MGKRWARMRWLGAFLFLAMGCWKSQPELRPPAPPEELRLPPEDDARFSAPVSYPKDVLNQGFMRKSDDPTKDNNPSNTPSPSRFGTGPGMRGY